MSKKNFDYCPKKAAFRKECVANPIIEIFGGPLPEDKIIVDTAGEYSKNVKATACYQLLKTGAITSTTQFVGVDNESKSGSNGIVKTNALHYGPDCRWHIPCVCDEIQNFCLKNRDRIGFISLDLQALAPNCFYVFESTLQAMQGSSHKFGICFNSIFSLPWNMKENLIKNGLVEEAMETEFQRYQEDNYSFVNLLQNYNPMSWFWYEGCGKSQTILGSLVFERKLPL
ncbi:MAG: hypothetical protein M0P12_00230 [Paludibacteraceae bacterium]|nr:hypothetical protein [Paludibacteraceae bacterium]MCK9615560.1 hypothetical protein [Candidatus Omnitrophota bacterium]